MNHAMIIGNLTKDPELKQTPNGISVCTFTVAVQRRHKGRDGERQADFIPVVVWREMADACARYLAKGKKAAICGEINVRNYEAQDGTKRYVTEIIANQVEFLSPKEESYAPPAPAAGAPTDSGFTPVDDDELPF